MQIAFPKILKLLVIVSIVQATHKLFVTNEFFPVASCPVGTPNDKISPSQITGTDVEMARLAFNYLNWTEGVDYQFHCTDFDQNLELVAENKSITGGFMDFPGLLEFWGYYKMGRVTSTPGGLSIIYKAPTKPSLILRVAPVSIWLIMGVAIPIAVGILGYFLEHRRESFPFYIYDAYNQFFHQRDSRAFQGSTMVLQWMYRILVLVFIVIYTTYLVEEYQQDNTFGGIKTNEDLAGVKVMTWNFESYVEVLRRYRALPIPISFHLSIKDTLAVFENRTDVNYLLLDAPLAKYYDVVGCHYYLALTNLFHSDYVPPFHINTPDTFIRQIEKAMLKVIANTTYGKIQEDLYNKKQIVPCAKPAFGKQYISLTDLPEIFMLFGFVLCAMAVKELTLRCLMFIVQKKFWTGVRSHIDKDVTGKMKEAGIMTLALSTKNLRQHVSSWKNCDLAERLKQLQEQKDSAIIKKLVDRVNDEIPKRERKTEKRKSFSAGFKKGLSNMLKKKSTKFDRVVSIVMSNNDSDNVKSIAELKTLQDTNRRSGKLQSRLSIHSPSSPHKSLLSSPLRTPHTPKDWTAIQVVKNEE